MSKISKNEEQDLLKLFDSLNTAQQLKMARSLIEGKKINSSTNITTEDNKTVSFDQPFVYQFTSNFRVLSDMDISKNEMRVLSYILELMDYGNLINVSQASICKELKIASGNMSNIFKKLREKGVLIEREGHLFVNSNIFAKGITNKTDFNRKQNLLAAQNRHAEIYQYPDDYIETPKKEKRKLNLKSETQEVYSDAFFFDKNKKNNARPKPQHNISKKPRKVYKRFKDPSPPTSTNKLDIDKELSDISDKKESILRMYSELTAIEEKLCNAESYIIDEQ